MKKVTIRFTQCDSTFKQDEYNVRACTIPFIHRITSHKFTLRYKSHPGFAERKVYSTLDEHFVLTAQMMHRRQLLDVELISVCNCDGHKETLITLDSAGDMLEDPHHGFFGQRLPLLLG